MADESNSYRDVLSRRRFVELAGVSGAAALAGCDSGGSGDTDTPSDDDGGSTETDSSGKIYDKQHKSITTVSPASVQWNAYNSADPSQVSHFLLYEKWAQYNYKKGSYVPALVTDWEFTGDTFEMTIRDDITWTNGDKLTSEDIAVQLGLMQQTEDAVFDFADGFETPSDTEIVLNISGDVNPALIEFAVFERFARYDRATFGDVLEKTKNAEDNSPITGFVNDKPNTHGPFKIKDKGEQLLLTERHDGSPHTENINYTKFGFNYLGGGNQARQQALLSLSVDSDYSVFVPPRIVADFPDAVQEIQTPAKWGIGLAANFDRPHTKDRAVRQAIQHVINREQVVRNAAPRSKAAPDIPTGIAVDDQERWLGDVKDSFETYGKAKSQTKKAKALLEDAGYSKVDGTWQDPKGNVVSLPVTVPNGWSDWVLAVETAVDQLKSFGFKASVNGTGSYWEDLTGDFKLIAAPWLPGAPRGAYPYFSLRNFLYQPLGIQPINKYPAQIKNDTVQGKEATRTVPARKGSGTVDIKPAKLVPELAKTDDEKRISEITTKLAWLGNQDLPIIPLAEKKDQTWLTGDEWDLPDNVQEDSDGNVKWANTWLTRQGKMNYQP